MSTTLTPTSESGSGMVRHSGQRPRWLAVFAAIVLLAIGGVGGWMIGSRGEDHPKAVAAGYESLTARQKQMLDVLEKGQAAWRKGDGAAVAALFTPDAVLVNPSGSFAPDVLKTRVAAVTMDLRKPVVFNGNVATVVESYAGTTPTTEVFQFTTAGAVLISHYASFTPASS